MLGDGLALFRNTQFKLVKLIVDVEGYVRRWGISIGW